MRREPPFYHLVLHDHLTSAVRRLTCMYSKPGLHKLKASYYDEGSALIMRFCKPCTYASWPPMYQWDQRSPRQSSRILDWYVVILTFPAHTWTHLASAGAARPTLSCINNPPNPSYMCDVSMSTLKVQCSLIFHLAINNGSDTFSEHTRTCPIG